MQDLVTFMDKSRKKYLHIRFEECGLSFYEGIVMLVIENNLRSNQDNLSLLSGVDKFRMTRLMAALEEKDLIFRETNPSNKREKIVKLTKSGMDMASRLNEVMRDWRDICFEGFTQEEYDMLSRIMLRIAKNISNHEINGTSRREQLEL